MTTQTKSVVELAREADEAGVVGIDGRISNYQLIGLTALCEAYAAQAIEQYKQESLKGVELPEPAYQKWNHVSGFTNHYSKDQLHQAIAAAVLPLKAEIAQWKEAEAASNIAYHNVCSVNMRLQITQATLQSRVTQLEQGEEITQTQLSAAHKEFRDAVTYNNRLQQELVEALTYKQGAERYLLLRNQERQSVGVPFISSIKRAFDFEGTVLSGDAADTAIDAARAQEVKTPDVRIPNELS